MEWLNELCSLFILNLHVKVGQVANNETAGVDVI
jgi:hypothetical protein